MFQVRKLLLNQCVKSYSTSSSVVRSVREESAIKELSKERSLNQIQLIGRVGQDPKIGGNHDYNSDKHNRVVMFSLATNEYNGQTDDGAQKTRVDWHRVAVFMPRLQENCEKFVRQGDRLHITGKLHYNLVKDKNGVQRYVPSIVAEDIIFLTKFPSATD